MSSQHLFTTELNWNSTQSLENSENKIYKKSHFVFVDGKPQLNLSAAKAFKGDPKLYNPEDLLLSSVSSCHMMSYMYLCEQNEIELITYSDSAEAILEVSHDGSGRIIEVVLNPIVTISNPDQIKLANDLHQKANQLCFIANSCNFTISHNPTCSIV